MDEQKETNPPTSSIPAPDLEHDSGDPPSRHALLNDAFERVSRALAVDMPVLLHGCGGDGKGDAVRSDTCHYLARLTAQYLASWMDASLSAHDTIRRGADEYHVRHNTSLPALPPPNFHNVTKKKRAPPVPPPLAVDPQNHYSAKRQRAADDFWDAPLPAPRIKNKTTLPDYADTWVGVVGVDMHEDAIRRAYVRGPAALSIQSCLFPICHDAYVYGRVTALQTERRALVNADDSATTTSGGATATSAAAATGSGVLMDAIWTDMIQEEEQRMKKKKKKQLQKSKDKDAAATKQADDGDKKKKADRKRSGSGGGGKRKKDTASPLKIDDDESDSTEDEDAGDSDADDPPIWPGLNSLLPVAYRLMDQLNGTEHGEEDIW